MPGIRCSNTANLAYLASPRDNYGIGYYMRPLNAGGGLGMEVAAADDGKPYTTDPHMGKLVGWALAIAAGIIIAGKLPRQIPPERRSGVKRNPYGPKAKFVHLRVRDPQEFSSLFTIDPGRQGHIKAVIGRLKGQGVSTTQAVLVPKSDIPKKDLQAMLDLEARLESRPAGSSGELRKIVCGVSPKVGRQINKRPSKRRKGKR